MAVMPEAPKNLTVTLTIEADDRQPSTRTYYNPENATIESDISRRIVDIVAVNDEERKTVTLHRTTTTITIVEEQYISAPSGPQDSYYHATGQEPLS